MFVRIPCLLLLLVLVGSSQSSFAADGDVEGYEVKKVNHELLDDAGYNTVEIGDLPAKARYQASLQRSGQYSAIRFIIHWRVPSTGTPHITIKLDARGVESKTGRETFETVLQQYPESPDFSGWVNLDLRGAQLKRFGKLMAWKVSILQDDKVMASRKSFTWDDSFLTSQSSQRQETTQAAPPATSSTHETQSSLPQ